MAADGHAYTQSAMTRASLGTSNTPHGPFGLARRVAFKMSCQKKAAPLMVADGALTIRTSMRDLYSGFQSLFRPVSHGRPFGM